MLDQTPQQLLEHLGHANGWWRSEAQKLIVIEGDQSVVPKLKSFVVDSDNSLKRLHALWTLEGLGAVELPLIRSAMKDQDPRVRAAAIRIAEPMMAKSRTLDSDLEKLLDDKDPNVVVQVLLSSSVSANPNHEEIENRVLKDHDDNEAIKGIANQMRAARAAIIAEQKKLEEIRRRNRVMAESMVRGKNIYTTLCVNCHGNDGKGVQSPDNPDLMLAPPLAGSSRVRGHKERLTRILIHGLIGPVDRKTYAGGLMLPMGSNSDQWIADVATFVPKQLGQSCTTR